MFWFLAPIIVGICVVIQSGINDKIQSTHNIFYALIYGNIIFIFLSILAFNLFGGEKNVNFQFWSKEHLQSLSWWFLIPGMMGITIVTGSTIGFEKMGASATITLIVSSQLITGIVWDYFIKSKPITLENIIGTIILMLGVLISFGFISLSKK